MAFSEIELKLIKHSVGKMCQRRSPAGLEDQLRITYKVVNHAVGVYEERPGWVHKSQWTSHGIAKFLYVRTTRKWKLYWMRQDLKWHSYGALPESTSLERLVAEVDNDPYGAFWG